MDNKHKALKTDVEKTEAANLNSLDEAPERSEDQIAGIVPELPTSLNEELSERIKDNPNKFIGCGG